MREYLVRLIYCEMLGRSASDCYAEAVKFAQQPNNLDKRVGEFTSLIKITPKIQMKLTCQPLGGKPDSFGK